MAILNILNESDNTLRKTSRKVDVITSRTHTLLDDMKETLIESGGVGLAAPQVGVLRRVVVVDTGEEILELINPEIIETSGSQTDREGCLSCPGKYGIVKRPLKVKLRALDRFGKMQVYTAQGLTARCFCHETDHLDGILFLDKVERMCTEEELIEECE